MIFFSISEGIESVKYEKSVACYRKNLYHTARSKEWLPAIGIEKINCSLDAVLFGHFSISVVHEIHEDSELIRWGGAFACLWAYQAIVLSHDKNHHNHNILGKLGVASRKQMLRYAAVLKQKDTQA